MERKELYIDLFFHRIEALVKDEIKINPHQAPHLFMSNFGNRYFKEEQSIFDDELYDLFSMLAAIFSFDNENRRLKVNDTWIDLELAIESFVSNRKIIKRNRITKIKRKVTSSYNDGRYLHDFKKEVEEFFWPALFFMKNHEKYLKEKKLLCELTYKGKESQDFFSIANIYGKKYRLDDFYYFSYFVDAVVDKTLLITIKSSEEIPLNVINYIGFYFSILLENKYKHREIEKKVKELAGTLKVKV